MKVKRRHLLLVIWLGFIVYASLAPSNDLPKFLFFPHFDKVIHWGIYLILTLLLIPSLLTRKNYLKSYWISAAIAISTGILFEFLQLLVGHGRTASLSDVVANSIGALTGVLIYHLIIKEKHIEKLIFKIE